MYEAARARFFQHQKAFADNPALRVQYARWYGWIGQRLPDPALGPCVELGSGPGLAREFLPRLILTDFVGAPWHALRTTAEMLPFASERLAGLVLFDVLHHLVSAQDFFSEAERVLCPGGRVILCEPYVSPLSYPIYRFLHEEGLDRGVDPWNAAPRAAGAVSSDVLGERRDPFAGNQAVPTALLFSASARAELSCRFPRLRVIERRRFAGLAYPASGGFGRRALLPAKAWQALDAIETRLPEFLFALIGFRMLAVIEKR